LKRLTNSIKTSAPGWVAIAISAGLAVAAEEPARSYSPVTVSEVWRAAAGELRGRGWREEQLPRIVNIELPVAVPARGARELHVSAMCWDADSQRVRLRMECREAGACLPFLAYLRRDSGERDFFGIDFPGRSQAGMPSCRLASPGQSRSLPREPPTIRSGERALAVLSAGGLRVSAAVTCLERGARGEIIRVRGEEGRIFRARVAGPALVEALPE